MPHLPRSAARLQGGSWEAGGQSPGARPLAHPRPQRPARASRACAPHLLEAPALLAAPRRPSAAHLAQAAGAPGAVPPPAALLRREAPELPLRGSSLESELLLRSGSKAAHSGGESPAPHAGAREGQGRGRVRGGR